MPERVRVCLLCDSLGVGGAEMIGAEVLAALDSTRFAAEILCLRQPGEIGSLFARRGIPLTVLGRRGRYDRATLPALVRHFRGRGVDVVFMLTQHAPVFFGRIASRLARRPRTVLAAHGVPPADGSRSMPRWMLESMMFTDVLVLLGDEQRRQLQDSEGLERFRWRRAPVTMIPNGTALGLVPSASQRAAARAELGLGVEDAVVGVVGGLRPEKGQEVLLRALLAMNGNGPQPHLVIVGDGERGPALRSLARALGLDGRVRFTGTRLDARSLIPAFDVACLASRWEAYPLSVMEAMAAGVPVVVSDCGGLPSMVSQGVEGMRCPPGDERAFAAALEALLADPSRRALMGAAARMRAERDFDLAVTVRRYEELFAGLVQS
jgi:glycosyltransferase involved in cell wall biosynthesis